MANQNTAARVLELARAELGAASGEKYLRYFNQVNAEGIVLPLNVAWCAAWVTWVMRQAGVPPDSVLNYKGCSTGSEWFAARGRFRTRQSGYIPKPGDIIMYEWDPRNEGTPFDDGDDHTGIVERAENGKVYTIEGNNGGMCRRDWWALNNAYISGYCVPLYNLENEKEDEEMTEERVLEIIQKYEADKAKKAASEWAKPALQYCKDQKIMVGDANGSMRPRSNITREEYAQAEYANATRYKTIDDIPGWAKDTVQEFIDLHVIAGYGKDDTGRLVLNMSESELRGLAWMVRYLEAIFQQGEIIE